MTLRRVGAEALVRSIIHVFIPAMLLLPSLAVAQPQGCRYLIIAADEYTDAVRPLADWKTRKGMLARVVRLSEAGSTPAQVRSWIRNAWSTWPLKPEYVLLACNPSQLPGYDYWDDTYYGDMTGDYVMELPVGRLPAEDLHECSTMVAKTLAYERFPAADDTLWYLKGTTVISERDSANPDPYYQVDSRLARQYWLNHGYVMAESLFNLAGDSSPQLLAALHDGRAFITYRGAAGGRWEPPFLDFYPGNWHNGTRLPVVVGATCATVTLVPGEEMLGDACLRYGSPDSLGGMVAYFGTTLLATEVSPYRSACYRGFFEAIYDEGLYRLGSVTLRGRWRVDSLYHDPERYAEWALLGDPELNLWTSAPRIPDVSHAPTLGLGSQVFPVTVLSGSLPVSGALVCCLMDSTVYSWDTTNASGQALLNIEPTHPGPMAVTVTGRNLRPYEGRARVLVTGAAHVSYLRHSVIDTPPAGNGDSLAGPGEIITMPLWVINYGDSTAHSVTAVLSTVDTLATMLDSVLDLGDIPGHDSTCTSPQGFRVRIVPACPDRHEIGLDLRCHDVRGDTWQSGFVVPVSAPVWLYMPRP
jgi:gingipain R